MNGKLLVAVAAAALTLPFTAAVGHADPPQDCTGQGGVNLTRCQHDATLCPPTNPTCGAGSAQPVCQQPNNTTNCDACRYAFASSGQFYYRAAWACGYPGFEHWYSNAFPCSVGTHSTNRQPNCDGKLESNGTFTRSNGQTEPAAGQAINAP